MKRGGGGRAAPGEKLSLKAAGREDESERKCVRKAEIGEDSGRGTYGRKAVEDERKVAERQM